MKTYLFVLSILSLLSSLPAYAFKMSCLDASFSIGVGHNKIGCPLGGGQMLSVTGWSVGLHIDIPGGAEMGYFGEAEIDCRISRKLGVLPGAPVPAMAGKYRLAHASVGIIKGIKVGKLWRTDQMVVCSIPLQFNTAGGGGGAKYSWLTATEVQSKNGNQNERIVLSDDDFFD